MSAHEGPPQRGQDQTGGEPDAEPQRRKLVIAIPLVILAGLALLVLVWQLMH